MKNILALVGGAWVLTTIYRVGEMVGEIKGSVRTVKDIHNEFKTEKKRIWETEAKA